MKKQRVGTFACIKYTNLDGKENSCTVALFNEGSIQRMKRELEKRALMDFSFVISKYSGRTIYVLSVHNNLFYSTNYGFLKASRMVEFAKLLLPDFAQLEYREIPSIEDCDNLVKAFHTYPGFSAYIKVCRLVQSSSIEMSDEDSEY